MSKFFKRHGDNDQKALLHYRYNIMLSEAFYPSLCVFEVALRNSMHYALSRYFQSDAWMLSLSQHHGLETLRYEVERAVRAIQHRKEAVTPNKIIAELQLGFWVRLLNAEHERILWKPLRHAFPHVPKNKRQRHTISAPLNAIRRLRNRIFHHEPICWNIDEIEKLHFQIMMVLGWLHTDLPSFLDDMDRLPIKLVEVKGFLYDL